MVEEAKDNPEVMKRLREADKALNAQMQESMAFWQKPEVRGPWSTMTHFNSQQFWLQCGSDFCATLFCVLWLTYSAGEEEN